MQLHTELSDLTPTIIQQAIESENKDKLRDVIIQTIEEAQEKNVRLDSVYYAYHVACSDEVFDQFSLGTIKSVFRLHGYDVTWKDVSVEDGLCIGKVTIQKEDFVFEMTTMEGMHDSLYAYFVDTKTARILSV